jgi:hypothetical protein
MSSATGELLKTACALHAPTPAIPNAGCFCGFLEASCFFFFFVHSCLYSQFTFVMSCKLLGHFR